MTDTELNELLASINWIEVHREYVTSDRGTVLVINSAGECYSTWPGFDPAQEDAELDVVATLVCPGPDAIDPAPYAQGWAWRADYVFPGKGMWTTAEAEFLSAAEVIDRGIDVRPFALRYDLWADDITAQIQARAANERAEREGLATFARAMGDW